VFDEGIIAPLVPFKATESILPYADREKVILYQGALNEGRGLETAIEAMQELPGLTLCLAGEGDLSSGLRELTEVLGVEDRVRFLGRIKPEELAIHTSKALIGLNLLENRGMSYYYSLANKFFDYIQYGTPSINMDFPEYASIQDNYEVGILLDELRVDKLVEHVQTLVDQRNWQRCSDACRVASEEFHWKKERERLVAIIKKALGDKREIT
jgi:glycosyltransferase involved in cell wall biosynthesis